MDEENEERQPSPYDDDGEQEKGLFRWMNAFVVLVAVAGFFGLAWYAYKGGDTAVDVNTVEMVEADNTPVKEAPANPGGMQIPNQDKTVYNLINGSKTDKPVAERILPAPEEPVERSGETESWMSDKIKNKTDAGDHPDAQQAQAAANATSPAPVPAPAEKPQETSQPKAEQFNPAKVRAQHDSVQKQDTAPLPAATPAAAAGGTESSAVAQNTLPAPANAPVSSPAQTAPVPKAVTPTSPAAASPQKPKANAVKADAKDDDDDDAKEAPVPQKKPGDENADAKRPSGVLAQLGAYKSAAEAKSRWAKISQAFSDDLEGKQHYVLRADLGSKGVYYRLQVGPFKNSGEAEEFCLSFVSAGQGCFAANGK